MGVEDGHTESKRVPAVAPVGHPQREWVGAIPTRMSPHKPVSMHTSLHVKQTRTFRCKLKSEGAKNEKCRTELRTFMIYKESPLALTHWCERAAAVCLGWADTRGLGLGASRFVRILDKHHPDSPSQILYLHSGNVV